MCHNKKFGVFMRERARLELYDGPFYEPDVYKWFKTTYLTTYRFSEFRKRPINEKFAPLTNLQNDDCDDFSIPACMMVGSYASVVEDLRFFSVYGIYEDEDVEEV